ncbi:MAG TPA: DoxX family membrane protein [Ignavibacteria bacterium]|nr:DoxX family membrane protein [Ignavibacteria bacterium]
MKYITNTYVLWVAKVFIGLIFVLSGIEKIADPSGFSDAIANYKLMPNFIINFFAISIPWIELVCGILLIFNQNIKENAFIYISLMSIFTIMVLIAVLRGLDIDCGCFGTQNVQAVGITKIIENLALIFLAVYVFIYNDKSTHKVS